VAREAREEQRQDKIYLSASCDFARSD